MTLFESEEYKPATYICSWCKQEIEIQVFPSVEDFILSFEEGTTGDWGPVLSGYEVDDMCTSCALKLKDKLIELGIEVKEIKI